MPNGKRTGSTLWAAVAPGLRGFPKACVPKYAAPSRTHEFRAPQRPSLTFASPATMDNRNARLSNVAGGCGMSNASPPHIQNVGTSESSTLNRKREARHHVFQTVDPLSRVDAFAFADDAVQLFDVAVKQRGGLALVVHDVTDGHALVGIKRDAHNARVHFA